MYYAQTVSFELKDGRLLECRYTMSYTPSTYWEPSELGEPSDPEYYLDGEETFPEFMPKGLAKLAEAMYCTDNDKRFKYEGDYEHDDDY